MQDRYRQIDELSCDARPDHTFGSTIDIESRHGEVGLTSNSRHQRVVPAGLQWAMCGRLRVGKSFVHVCSIGRCSHVFGLWMRFT
jgi:hypothetical protein